MERTIYYKNVTIDGERYTIVTPTRMSNDEFSEKVNYVRRIFGYAIYPRWLATRMLLGDTCDMIKKNGIYKHRVKKAVKQLIKEFDAFEKLHTMDFDPDWIEVMSGSMAMQLRPKVNNLRGALGGLMMQHGIKNYILYSYPQAVCVLSREGTEYHDTLMSKVREKYGLDLREVFVRLRGDKVLGCARALMSAIEDAVGERLPIGVNAAGTCAEVALDSLERSFYDDDILAKAFAEAQKECDERDFNDDVIAEQLSTKFNVKRT